MIFTRIVSILMIPILTYYLSTEEYGILSLIFTLILFTNSIITLEVSQAVSVYFPLSKESERKIYPSTALKLLLFVYIIFIVIILILSNFILEKFIKNEISNSIIIASSLLMATNGIFLIIQNQFRLEFNSRNFAIISIAYILLTSTGTLMGILYFNAGIKGVIWGQMIGTAIVSIFGLYIQFTSFNQNFRYTILIKMLKYSVPLVPAVLLQIGSQQIPKFILSMYSNLEEVGIYGLAYQIASFSALAVIGVQTALTPSILANYKEIETPKMLAKLFERFATFALILCAFLSIFSSEIISLFSNSAYQKSERLVPFLSFAIALNCFYIFFPGKLIFNKSGFQLIASASSFIVATVMGILLTKIDGSRGAALATLISSLIFFSVWCHSSQRLYPLIINWYDLCFSAILVGLVCYITNSELFIVVGIYSIFLKILIFILLVFLISKKYLIELKLLYLNRINL